MANLSGHVAAITGVSGDLGRSVKQAFLDAGAEVVGIARHNAEIEADLSSADSTITAMKAAHAIHGRLDSLIHLVGGFAGGAELADDAPATFDAMFDVNVRSAFYAIRAVTPLFACRWSGANSTGREQSGDRAGAAHSIVWSVKGGAGFPDPQRRGGKPATWDHG